MTDIENHMVIGEVAEYEGDRTEADILAEMNWIIGRMDADDVFEMIGNGCDDFDIELYDAVMETLAEPESAFQSGHCFQVGKIVLDEIARQIRERAENQV